MTFVSLDFGLFFSVFFILYWFVFNKSLRLQNILILVASYIFYGWWDWRFLSLIFISSSVDYWVGLSLDKTDDERKRKWLLGVSLISNLGILGFFKYFNFFLDNLNTVLGYTGEDVAFNSLHIILPVGISFYTLQTLSYTFDVYDRRIKATNNIVNFFSYVSFFPQLVAGPIEKSTSLLPQFSTARKFDYNEATDGLRQILWGFFKKMVFADNAILWIQGVLLTYDQSNTMTMTIFAFIACFQVYCDFSAYSDIAIGTARIIGFKLSKNFDFPFYSRNVSEFWQKWHISLISWIRVYVVGRLKGRSKWKMIRNILLIFVLSGLWHGASWNYILWGLLHGLSFLPLLLMKRKKYRKPIAHNRILPTLAESWQMFKVFSLFAFIGILFITPTVYDGYNYWYNYFTELSLAPPRLPSNTVLLSFVAIVVVEWLQRTREHGLDFTGLQLSTPVRWGIYIITFFIIVLFGGDTADFIYFQF